MAHDGLHNKRDMLKETEMCIKRERTYCVNETSERMSPSRQGAATVKTEFYTKPFALSLFWQGKLVVVLPLSTIHHNLLCKVRK
jgi:hypothetical protein